MTNSFEKKAIELLNLADVKINPPQNEGRPWDIKVHNENLYKRVLSKGSIGLGESYMDGWWDCQRLDLFFHKVLSARLDDKVKNLSFALQVLKAKLSNRQSKSNAYEIGQKHYDIGNDLYKLMLDKRMTYTCGYWNPAFRRTPKNLDQAQEAKLDLVCKKLGFKKGQKILDIGCGWGSFMKYACEKYKVSCVGITVSKEQVELGKELCKGLPIEFRLMDYRDLKNKEFEKSFDHVVSLGMFEHVGYKNYKEFFDIVNHCLKDDGLFLLHTIGWLTEGVNLDPWLDKYIFPGGTIPSLSQISKSSEKLFIIEDLHNFGADYYKTVKAWQNNFEKNYEKLKQNNPKYDERFRRMWNYYLLSCAGGFSTRLNQLWQIVFSKKGVKGGYVSVR